MRRVCVVLLVLLPSGAFARQDGGSVEGRKEAHAVRVAGGAISVDGRLDEAAWRGIPAMTDFVQAEPVEGARPTDRMEVRFAYDDGALYVGARMFSATPIQSPLGRRDEGEQAEHLVVWLDTYLNRRTASTFGVTAAGVRLDRYYPQDNDWPSDPGFDPVWEARTTSDDAGWSAELWIPFSQLRFADLDAQVWGLNVQRWIPSRNEDVYWSLVPRTEERWTSLFGDLHGIDGIRPSRRLELLPYVASSSQLLGSPDPANPFTGGVDLQGRVGLDAKVGLGSNLTLEAAVNPDFGQVEADPAEVNLSAFETFFQERRPFFLEGSQLLNGSVNNYFYSRRIGAAPQGRASGEFVDAPSTSTILGAGKMTGRLASGTSVGILAAVTDEESARTFSDQQFGRFRVAPRTTYAVARVEQEFGPPGSTIGVMATGVHRDLKDGDLLASRLARNAFSVSTDSAIQLKGGEYELRLYTGGTFVNGTAAAIDRVQRASARYLQRPDAGYLTYDRGRTSMSGGKSGASIERRRGRHWLWEAQTVWETPEFEPSDIGRLSAGDGIQAQGYLEYRETVPSRWWRAYSLRMNTGNEWNFGGIRQSGSLSPQMNITWPNFWQTRTRGTYNFRTQNARLTRGGPSMEQPARWSVNVSLNSSNASQTSGQTSLTYGRDEDGGFTFEIDGGVTLRPGPQWQLSIQPAYERELDTQQYLTTRPGGGETTFDSRYVFAHVDRSTYSTQFRLNYTFKPDLTLDFYGEPFASSGRFDHVGELVAARSRLVRVYGTEGTSLATLADGSQLVTDGPTSFTLRNRDFHVESFRSNLVLRWEWRAGSTLYLVWQQDRALEETASEAASFGDMFNSLGRRGDHYFAVKASFWFSPS